MALIGELITADSRELLRRAITDEGHSLAKRFGFTGHEESAFVTRMIKAVQCVQVEGVQVESSVLSACDEVIADALGKIAEHYGGKYFLSAEEHQREQGRKDAARVIALSVDPDYRSKTSEDDELST